MKKITIDEVKNVAKKNRFKPCKISKTDILRIRKRENPKLEDISWEEFEDILKKKGLAVFKAENNDFLKIMKNK